MKKSQGNQSNIQQLNLTELDSHWIDIAVEFVDRPFFSGERSILAFE